jgi:hypothetical protein
MGPSTWLVEHARLLDATIAGEVGRSLPVPAPEPTEIERVLAVTQIDEALCLARVCNARADRLVVTSSGPWSFPLPAVPTISRLDEPCADPIDGELLAVAASG